MNEIIKRISEIGIIPVVKMENLKMLFLLLDRLLMVTFLLLRLPLLLEKETGCGYLLFRSGGQSETI